MDFDRAGKGSDRYLMEFQGFLHMGRNNPRHQHRLGLMICYKTAL